MEKQLLKQLPQLNQKFFCHVSWRGNTSSASTIISLSECIIAGRVKKGDFIVGLTFGAGLQKVFYATRL